MPETLAVPRSRQAGSDFSPLARQVRASGLLDRRTGYYVRSIAANVLATAAVWVALAVIGDSWWQIALAVPAALLSTRTGFLGHDAGHLQISRSARTGRLLGFLLGNLMLGMSHGWWIDKHNRHHANPNHVDKDPDVAAGALVWTPEQTAERRGLLRWAARHQDRLFFPMLLLEGLNLQITSALELRKRSPQVRAVEGVLLAVHAVGYLALAFSLMSPLHAVVFILVHQGLFGLHLGSAFAPNHKGMPMPGPGERWDHLRRQVLTSRNVRGGLVTDWMLGGLNYQIEHHLFPSMPRPNLRKVQPLVREHCELVGLPYAETGLVDSYARSLRHLRTVGTASPAE
jgi:fatty acid desaturase